MQTTRQPRAGIPSFDEKLENEEEVLDALVTAYSKNQLDPGVWKELHDAAVRDDKVAELAFAYESVAQGRKLRTQPASVQAELFYRAATFFGDVLGDEFGGSAYLEKALAAMPSHEHAFERIDAQLTRAGEHKKLAEWCAQAAAQKSKSGQIELLERAADLFARAELEDKSIEIYQQLVRLEPANDAFRKALAQRYLATNRHRDLARLLEQTLTAHPEGEGTFELRLQLVDVFAHRLQEPERAMPHVEAILEIDKTNAEARRVATRLLESKGLAARAASALAPGATTTDERAKLYAIELENTRGPKRRDVLRRIGVLKQDELGDRQGAFASYEQALNIDPADDELRKRYITLGSELRGPLEVVKALVRAASVTKDAAAKARINAETGELLLRGGDPKRARSILASVLATPDADPVAALTAARALSTIFEGENDTKNLLDALTRIGEISPVEAEKQQANEHVAAMATQMGDVERATAAWRRLVDSPLRERALEALEPFYVEREAWEDLAFVLDERAKHATDPELARELSFRAALVLSTKMKETTAASEAWRRMVATYGPARDLFAQWMPILETERRWEDLAAALSADAQLASAEERPAVLARLGNVYLTRMRDPEKAIDAFMRALEGNPEEKTSRGTLEKLLASGDHRWRAATVLESVYRRAGDVAGLLKVLDVKAALSPEPEDRLTALEEAARVALDRSRDRALDFVSRGLREAVEHQRGVDTWLDRVDEVSEDVEPSRRASMFAKALGDREVDSPSLLVLAKRVGEAHASAGDFGAALGAYRKALAYEPGSADLIGRVDELLREQGNPEERAALYRAALERNPDPAQRRYLLHNIGNIERSELSNPDGAILAYKRALADDANDTTAFTALASLYAETEGWDELCKILEERLPRATSPDEARAIRAQLADVAARHGRRELAAEHARDLLSDPDLSDTELSLVERVAAVLDDEALLFALLERRVRQSTDPKIQVESLARLSSMLEQAGRRDEAIERLRQAADMARSSLDDADAIELYERLQALDPNDHDATSRLVQLLPKAAQWTKLPALYEALLERSTDVSEKIEQYLQLAHVYAERLGDVVRGYEAALAALELNPRDAKTLAETEGLAGRAGRGVDFARFVERLFDERSETSAELSAAEQIELRLAKARVLGTSSDTHVEATRAFRDVLEKATSDAHVEKALQGFEALLRGAAPSSAKTTNLRWLTGYRIERAAPEDRARLIMAAAEVEESELGATKEALALYKQALALNPEDLDALSAVSRLSLAEGDVEGALAALTSRHDASEGDARTALSVQIAYILANRLGRASEALDRVGGILEVAPHDSAALELAASLLKDPNVGAQAAKVLERSIDTVDDPALRIEVLKRLIAHSEPGSDTRVDSYRRLLDLLAELGNSDETFEMAIEATREWPREAALWDRVEDVARKLSAPIPVAQLYEEVLGGALPEEDAIEIGQRAVAFNEEWFDDPERIVRILQRVLDLVPEDGWAFDRIKLIFDAEERWEELFTLVDRIAPRTSVERRTELLEDAAQTAKDFANHAPRAIGYLEQLLDLKPRNARLAKALERLYEKNGFHRELIQLLGTQLETLSPEDAQRERARIARLWLSELGDPSSALIVVEDVLAQEVTGDALSVEIEGLLEGILAAASQTDEMRPSVAPPPEGVRQGSYAPVALGKGLVRQRAATLLKTYYAAPGREGDLARMLEIELEVATTDEERVRRHREIATIYGRLGQDERTSKHLATLVELEPHVAAHREEFTALSAKMARYDRLVDVLEAATKRTEDPSIRATLLMQAGVTSTQEIGDDARAIELFFRVLSLSSTPDDTLLRACHELDPLLARAGRKAERLAVLERTAELSDTAAAKIRALGEAARLARELDERVRATKAWETTLSLDPGNVEALDGLVALFEEDNAFRRLVDVLGKRSSIESLDRTARRNDRVRIATIQNLELDEADEAIVTWRGIEAAFGPSDEGTRALSALYRGRERWSDLADLLATAAARIERPETPEAKAAKIALLCELGDVQRQELDRADLAVATYERALELDPKAENARAGLHALLKHSAHRAEAVRVLLEAYRAADDWELVLELTEHRLSVSETAEQVAILREAATIVETRATDFEAAFALVRRALLLDPSVTSTLEELARLTETTRNHRSFADALRESAEITAKDAALTRSLLYRMGSVLEANLDEPHDALAAYAKVADEDPSHLDAARAVIRVANRTRRWDTVARVLAFGAPEGTPQLVEDATRVAADVSGFDELTRELATLVHQSSHESASRRLPSATARDLETAIAVWHRDHRGDVDASEAAYVRALKHDAENDHLLEALAKLQRRSQDRSLVETLQRLSDVRGEELGLLREAADTALAHVRDDGLSKSILSRILRVAIRRWMDGDTAPSEGPSFDAYVDRATRDLVDLHTNAGDHEAVVDLLVKIASLPWLASRARDMRLEAARVAATHLPKTDRATGIYLGLIEEDPRDGVTATELSRIYETFDRRSELLALKRRLVTTTDEESARLALRLEMANLEDGLGDVPSALRTLRANLDESKRHPATVKTLADLLAREEKFTDLKQLLATQATLAKDAEDGRLAADFHTRAAEVAETKLGDVDDALAHLSDVIALEPRAQAFDALARLSAGRGEHERAAGYLDRLRELVKDEERALVTLRLADALTAAGRPDDARERLESEVRERPASDNVRSRLVDIYRAEDAWVALADALSEGAAHAPDKASRLARLLEGAELHRTKTTTPDLAIPLLEQAADLSPDDNAIKLALADALGNARRYDDARGILRALIDAFGSRKPKERAPVHYQLARLDLAAGDRGRALVELDAATRIDPANASILQTLAELARDDGQLDRAERSYRALLTVLRRQENVTEDAKVTRAEVLVELSKIAARQGEPDRANEILESAFELAASNEIEARRLENALRQGDDHKSLVRALEGRLERAKLSDRATSEAILEVLPDAATVYAELGRLYEEPLGRFEDAFEMRLAALTLDPAWAATHDASQKLARQLGKMARYEERLERLAETAKTPEATSEVLSRWAQVLEERGEDARAVSLYERATETRAGDRNLIDALDRLYKKLGNHEGQARVLGLRLELDGENIDASADALYRLAEIRFFGGDVQGGCDALERGFEVEADIRRAVQLLREAADAHPTSERVVTLYERLTRTEGHERALIDALVRKAKLPDATSEPVREAVDLATNLGDHGLARTILETWIEGRDEDAVGRAWGLAQLSALYEKAGDLRKAATLKEQAASISDPDESRRLMFEVANLAAGALDDLKLAASTLEQLHEREPSDKEAWLPLLDVYRRMKADEKLVALLAEVSSFVDEPQERSRLRFEHVRLGMERLGLSDEDAARELREIVDEDGSAVDAAILLGTLLERSGLEEELIALLVRQLESAKDRQDADAVRALSQRLGQLLEPRDATQAREIYYTALDWDPKAREILLALERIHEEAFEPDARADVMERRLALESGEEAEELAFMLRDLRRAQGDFDGGTTALALGFDVAPQSERLRKELETVYGEAENFDKLAELYVKDARARRDAAAQVAQFQKAADMYRTTLSNPSKAADVLREAVAVAPDDTELLVAAASGLEAADRFADAEETLTTAIEARGETHESRATLLGRRAFVRAKLGKDDEALADFEGAIALGDVDLREALAGHLEAASERAAQRGDATRVRDLRLHLARIDVELGKIEAARTVLTELLKTDGKDRETLRALAQVDELEERWDAASATYRRLVGIEEGEAVVSTALKLLETCEKAGRLSDARGGLERARMTAPNDLALRTALATYYEKIGALKELAEMALEDARAAGDVGPRFEALLRAGQLFLMQAQDPSATSETAVAAAIVPLEEAHALRPSDLDGTALLSDAYVGAGRLDEGRELLERTIAGFKGRRARELSALYHRLARIAELGGDRDIAIAYLNTAVDMDSQNGVVASELAYLAMEATNWDVAHRALRTVTMLKAPGPLSKALAYQHLGQISEYQGDAKRAIGYYKRALAEDPALDSARMLHDALLAQS